MSSWSIMGLTFASIFCSALMGFVLRAIVHEHHRSSATQEVIKLAAGIVVTMTALVLGLLIATTKQGFDAKAAEVRTFVVNITLIDRSMRHYVPSLLPERQVLATFVQAMLDRLWAADPGKFTGTDALEALDKVRDRVRNLDPQSGAQKFQQARVMSVSDTLMQTSNELLESTDSTIPTPMLVVVVIWLSVIFLGFGLFSPFNPLSGGALAAGAAAVSMSMFLIVEMNTPFNGFITIPQRQMEQALAEINQALRTPP